MKKFQFTLESLLKYREYLEKQARQELSKAIADINECIAKIEDYNRKFTEMKERLDKEAAGGINADFYRLYTAYLSGLEIDITNEIERLGVLNNVAEQKRGVLKEKSIDKKVIENLKEKKKEAYYTEMFLEEQKANDDMVVLRRARGINK